MKVLVIGATGLTGRIAVRRLRARGDQVTALARTPGAIPADPPALRVVQGDARDAASLERAVEGQDAVLSAFGPRSVRRRDGLQQVFMRNLVSAMEERGPRRLSNLSAWGAGDSHDDLTAFGKLVERLFLHNLFEDKARGEAILFASSLEYVNVRPSRLSNGRARGGVKASLRAQDLRWWPLMTREDLAAFMIEQLTDPTWVGQSPLIGY
jgi:uncharacterized protein YbjT (DUF2867 family)